MCAGISASCIAILGMKCTGGNSRSVSKQVAFVYVCKRSTWAGGRSERACRVLSGREGETGRGTDQLGKVRVRGRSAVKHCLSFLVQLLLLLWIQSELQSIRLCQFEEVVPACLMRSCVTHLGQGKRQPMRCCFMASQ